MSVTKSQIIQWLEDSLSVLEEQKGHLTDLDAAIGDADHGSNMARGFKHAVAQAHAKKDDDIGAILQAVGMGLISKVGGASGPLYGTFFMRAAAVGKGKEQLTNEELYKLLESGVGGVKSRGRAEVGDKTMIDTWEPALDAFRESLEQNNELDVLLADTAAAAKQGMKDTIPLQAKKGRASYLGERSKGHQDPGATSSYYILQALADGV